MSDLLGFCSFLKGGKEATIHYLICFGAIIIDFGNLIDI